jgi:hypothetical protein
VRVPLFTLADISFVEVVPKWLELKDAARIACNILFGLRYIGEGYTETRALGVASAAESLHRALRKASTPLTRAEFRKLKDRIYAMLSEDPIHLTRFAKEGLRNNPDYYDRALGLAAIPSAEAVDALLGDRKVWAMSLKNSRNDFAHANDRSGRNDETSDVFLLLEVTYALMCLVLMAELGISADVQRLAVERHPRISHFSRQYKNRQLPQAD